MKLKWRSFVINKMEIKINKEEVKRILVGLQDLDASSVIREDNTLNIQELNLLPEVLKAKEELRSLGVGAIYLRKHFQIASWLIAV